MHRELTDITSYLRDEDLDGYLIEASGDDANQRYVSGFGGVDAFTSLYTDGAVHLLVRGLDRALARERSNAETVSSPADFDRADLVDEYGPTEADRRVRRQFLDRHGVSSVAVPSQCPVGVVDGLRASDIGVTVDTAGVIEGIRAIKSDREIAHIRETQRATERAMRRAMELLSSASIKDDQLWFEGEPLTSERVKSTIELALLRADCVAEAPIVAGGTDAANPHDRGSGPLPAAAPIVIDIFPRHRDTHYHADMTRTVCVGTPTANAREWYDLTEQAHAAALDSIAPGVSSESVHEAACSVYESAGIPTTRTDEGTETGFIHGTGHGVGLAVHERPRVSTDGEELVPGHVITIEPGVYDPAVGGIRLEDLVVVTADGYENLTEFEMAFQP